MTAPALPSDTGYGTVRWTVVGISEDDNDADSLPQGEPINGTVTFTPQFTSMRFVGDVQDSVKKTVLPRPETYVVTNGKLADSSGHTDIKLVANDSPATSPQGWNYRADFEMDGGYSFGTFYFAVGSGQIVDLTDVVPQADPVTGQLYIAGPPGPGFTFRGAWATGQNYSINDVVTSGGSTFVVTSSVPLSSGAAPTPTTPGASYALWSAKGDPGSPGAPGTPGVGVPAGGASGQVLKKTAAADYSTGWSDPAVTAAQVTDATATGRSVLKAADAPAARAAIGAGTSSLALGTTSSTAKAGDWKPAAADLTATGTRDSTTFLRGDNTWAVPAGGGGGASPVTLTGRPVNIFNTGNTQADAIGDGVLHPLSDRFASLAAAQAVFPRATALTQSIDRHALQLAVDNNPVVEGRIDKKLLIDATVFTRAAGFQTLAGLYLLHQPSVAAFNVLSSGNTAGGIANVSAPTNAEAPEYFGLTLRNILLDGNRGNAVTGSTTPLYLCHCSDLVVEDFELKSAQGNGFTHFGVTDAYSNRQSYRRVKVTDCNGTYGFRNSLKTRKVNYTDLHVSSCTSHGIYFDHSEAQCENVVASLNGGHGVFINNVFGCSFRGIRSTENAHHGIYVLGLTDSQGADWVALNNGTAGGGWSDVYFTATAQSYGVTKNASVRNVLAGRTANGNFGSGLSAAEDYGLYVEDGVNTDVDIEVRYPAAAGLGFSRLPAAPGTLVVQEAKPGTARPTTKLTVVTMTAAAYAALAVKDGNTLYVVAG